MFVHCERLRSEIGKVISCTTFKQINGDKPRDNNIQERIRDFHESLEDTILIKYFGTSLDGYESFINDD